MFYTKIILLIAFLTNCFFSFYACGNEVIDAFWGSQDFKSLFEEPVHFVARFTECTKGRRCSKRDFDVSTRLQSSHELILTQVFSDGTKTEQIITDSSLLAHGYNLVYADIAKVTLLKLGPLVLR